MTIKVEVGEGELIDKITILEVKLARISDPAKLKNVRHEYEVLEATAKAEIPPSAELDALRAELKTINEDLWVIEDDIRICEKRSDFGDEFIRLARAVYFTNDRRAAVKRKINDLLGASIVEEKSYC
ncbi:hypothetical protein IP70_24880 [alpha proteobacterium AAP38]|jgi:hypothetical protein|uniref:DUF6165 family protein n=1 Tax=Niveispirillum sp. TaxID=1917217 RepID=UPI0006B8C638|nr:hypothetical protein IP70_24880 [alpha proteobacterium AAP38]